MTRINEIRQREAKATAGPWQSMLLGGPLNPERVDLWSVTQRISGLPIANVGLTRDMYGLPGTYSGDVGSANFISHSRADIPWLLGVVERLAELVKELTDLKKFDECAWCGPHDWTSQDTHKPDCPAMAALREMEK